MGDKSGAMQAVGAEEVMAAADALSAAGIKPTYAAVREHLGNRGSYTTITKWMKAWSAKIDREDSQDSSPEPPEAVKTLFDRLWGATWKEAAKGAVASFEAERSRLVQETHSATEAAEQAAGYVRQLEAEIEGWEVESAQSKSEIATLRQTVTEKVSALDRSTVALATAKERIQQLEQRLELAQAQLATVNELNQSLAKLLEAKNGDKDETVQGNAG